MTATRIAVVGAGTIGRAHMAAAQSAGSGCTLSAVVDPSPAARPLAEAAGVPLLDSLDQLFASGLADGVVLATPNQLHAQQARACMAAGLPMLLEKPITPTVADARALVQEAETTGATILIGHHRAHSPIMAKAQQVVRSGQLGRLVTVAGSATFFKPDHYFADGPWRTQPGGGPILLNLIHEVHNLRMLCGEIAAVQAFSASAARGHAVEDTAAITLRFANGVLGTFILSDSAASARSWEQTSQENPAYPSYDDEDCYVISGMNGSLSVPTMRLKTYPRPEDRSWWKPFELGRADLVRSDPIARQMRHFGAVVRGEAQPLVSARDGLRNLQVTEAVALAAQSGRTVEISD